jgi:glycosyltransferase involved in cell wall biosynthesis
VGTPSHPRAGSLSLKGRGIKYAAGSRHNLQEVPPKYRHGLYMADTLDGVPIRRIRFPHLPRESKIGRGIQHFIYGLWLTVLASLTPRADAVIVFSPPLPLPWLTCLMGRTRRMPVMVNIQDLFPREAVELGMLTNPLLIRGFEAMERQVHRLAAAVTVHSPGNKEHVLEHGGERERVHVIYNWVVADGFQPGPRNNSLRASTACAIVLLFPTRERWAGPRT